MDCLLTDVDLGAGLTGLDLASAVRNKWSDIGIIIISGKPHAVPDEIGDNHFFLKPFSMVDVVGAVRLMADKGSMH